ncbi:MAG TPA: hypothetical protein VJ654_20350 [Noviherbaspirillum sp.]|nr:hypothetical protein [Noviherbaspirillum sp.]
MPTVPRYDGFQATPNTLPQARIEARPMQDVAGQQAQQMGHAMANFGQHMAGIAADIQQEANAVVAKDIDTQTTSALNNALWHPETGFMAKQGKDVVEGYEKTVEDLQTIRQQALDDIKNPAVRKLAQPVIDARMQHALEAINRHSGQETRKYEVQAADSRAMVSLQDAAYNYADDQRFAQAIGVAHEETATLAKLHGWDDATARLQAMKYQDAGFKMRYEAWRLSDPAGAFTHFQKNADQISPLTREQIGRQLFQSAAPVLADQLNQAGGIGIVGGASGPLPRGVRNNNPGNVMRGTEPWQGEVLGNDPRYVTFATPEAGIRAMGKTLLTYQDHHGLNSVSDIVARWAPATENNTVAYVNTVASAMGVKPDAPLDLHDADTLGKLARAMIHVENGQQPYSDQQITAGLNSALNGTPLPAASDTAQRSPVLSTGNAVVDSLPADWRLHVVQLARNQAHQDMATARDALRTKLQDATSEYMTTGIASNPPNEGDFIRSYGQIEGMKRYQEFQNVATLGQTLQQVKTLPANALANLLQVAKPAPGEGFAARQHNYEILTNAIEQVQQARAQDPVGYAIMAGSYGLKPISRLDDPKVLMQDLSRRAAAATQMAADYGTPPQLLTRAEAKGLAATLKAMPIESQKTQLAAIYQGVGDMNLFKQTMQAIAPDNPTAAVAGIFQARGFKTTQARDVANLILRGQAILSPDTKEDGSGHAGGKSLLKMPEQKLLLSDWISETGDAFKGKEHAADLFMQTAKAIYAARSAEEGDYTGVLDSKRWKAAINMATGGIQSHNGSKIVTPYGMGYDQFQNALKAQVDRITSEGNALNTTPGEMMRLPLENVGDGRYLFRRGAGYLVDKDGRPITVNLSGGR